MDTGTQLSVFACSDVGKKRQANEDQFLVGAETGEFVDALPVVRIYDTSEKPLALMVSDGVGGASAGEKASLIAVKTVDELHRKPISNGVTDTASQIEQVLMEADRRIQEAAIADRSLTGMGSTATLLIVEKNVAYIGQIGDSRAYLKRGDNIYQLTNDQSAVAYFLKMNMISPDEVKDHPRGNVVLQALGTESTLRPEISRFTLQKEDLILLCSDGLTGPVTNEEINTILESYNDLEQAGRTLIARANINGGQDNITVVLARCDGDAFLTGDEIPPLVDVLVPFKYPHIDDPISRSLSETIELEPSVQIKTERKGKTTELISVFRQIKSNKKSFRLVISTAVSILIVIVILLGIFRGFSKKPNQVDITLTVPANTAISIMTYWPGSLPGEDQLLVGQPIHGEIRLTSNGNIIYEFVRTTTGYDSIPYYLHNNGDAQEGMIRIEVEGWIDAETQRSDSQEKPSESGEPSVHDRNDYWQSDLIREEEADGSTNRDTVKARNGVPSHMTDNGVLIDVADSGRAVLPDSMLESVHYRVLRAPIITSGDSYIIRDRAVTVGEATIIRLPKHGTATIIEGGIQYVSDSFYEGPDTLIYFVEKFKDPTLVLLTVNTTIDS